MDHPLVQLAFAFFFFFSLVAGVPLAVGVTWWLLARFRRRVAHLMGISSPAPPLTTAPGETAPLDEGAAALDLELIAASRESARRGAPELRQASRRAARRVAVLYLISSSAVPLVLVAVVLGATGLGSTMETPFQWWLNFGVLFLINATPAFLAAATVLDGRSRALVLAVLLQLGALWALDQTLGLVALQVWILTSLGSTIVVLLLNTRRLRAVGPGVYAGIVLIVCGIGMGQLFASRWMTYRLGLSWEALRAAHEPFRSRLAELPLRRKVDLLLEFAREPLQFMQLPEPGPALWVQYAAISVGAGLLGIGAAWLLSKRLARAYATRRASDLMIRVDVLMLIFTLAISLAYVSGLGLTAACGLAGYAGYWLLSRWLLRRARGPEERHPRALLHLRVFGFDRRTQALLEDLQQRWRHFGPIHLIAGADVAYTTIELYEFLQFVEGRLGQAFVQSRSDLEERLAEIQTTPDPDGRYRIHDFFCYHDTWRPTMSALAESADVALMDLRGFNPASRGCIFEIEQLLATVDPGQIVLVIDESTDQTFLRRTLQSAWRKAARERSADDFAARPLRILEASTHRRRTLEALMGLLHDAGERGTAGPPERSPALSA